MSRSELRPLRIIRSPLALLVGLVSFACAPTTPPGPRRVPTTRGAAAAASARPVYVAADQFDFRALLGDPPADDSQAHAREIDRMLELQERRTPEEVRRCKAAEEVTVFVFSTVLGERFNPDDLPVTAGLMRDVFVQARDVSAAAKKMWSRVRPPRADARIKPCVRFEESGSYPSGHATRGVVWASLLAEIFPDRRDELMAGGRQIGDDRFLAGMHYPSDVAAGQKLGDEIARRLLADAQFRAELDRAKAECLAHVR